MKAIILAAGRGKRLGDLTKELPKCLLDLGSKTILDYQLESLMKCGIDEILLVVGFGKEKVIEHVRQKHANLPIKFIYNDVYDKTDNAYSTALALNQLGDTSQVILLDGDVIFDPRLLSSLVVSQHENVLLADEIKKVTEEDANVVIEEGYAVAIGKSYYPGDAVYTSMIKLGGGLLEKFKKEINEKGSVLEWYSEPLTRILKKNKKEMQVIFTKGLSRCEVDIPQEIDEAKKILKQFKNGI